MTVPPPLVPANVDLRSMPEMPLEVGPILNGAITVSITETAFRAAVLLWCASWHEIPAASLPDDDKLLARFAGYGYDVSKWLEIKDQALWKFIKCSDGRWYHPKIAEKAIRTWEYRENYRRRMEAARSAKADKKDKPKSRNGSSVTEQGTAPVTGSVSRLNQTKPNCLKDRSTSLATRIAPLHSTAGELLAGMSIRESGK